MLYCYSSTNITTTSISFRHRVSNEEAIWLNSVTKTTKDTEDVYGIKDQGPAVQELGKVDIRDGRVISFPNARAHFPPIRSENDDGRLTAYRSFKQRSIPSALKIAPNQAIASSWSSTSSIQTDASCPRQWCHASNGTGGAMRSAN